MSGDAPALHKLTETKLTTFAIGQVKKSRFQREREEKEQKRKKDEEDAAIMYESFVESFESRPPSTSKGLKEFVKGGRERSSGEAQPFSSSSKPKMRRELDSFMDEAQDVGPKMQPASVSSSNVKKSRQMDELFDEIKNKHETHNFKSQIGPAPRGPVEERGSFDNGDPTTTNLFVGNLNPLTTEEHLSRIFGRYGSILSVKIMWPRNDDERARGRNTGFVSFVKRRDAERALAELKDSVVDGHIVQMGWGKAVKGAASTAGAPSIPAATQATSQAPTSGSPKSSAADVINIELPTDPRRRSLIDMVASYVASDGEAFETAVKLREAQNPEFSFLFDTAPHLSRDALYYRWRVLACANGDCRAGPPSEPFAFVAWRADRLYQPLAHGAVFRPPPLPTILNRGAPADEIGDSAERRQKRSRSIDVDAESREVDDTADIGEWSRPARKGGRDGSSHKRRRGRRDDDEDSDGSQKERFANMTGAQIQRFKEARRLAKRQRLSQDDYDDWLDLLEALTLSRSSIAECMAFAFDHVDCCADVVAILQAKLLPQLHLAVGDAESVAVDVVHLSLQRHLAEPLREAVARGVWTSFEVADALGAMEAPVDVANRCGHHPAVYVAALFLLSDLLHNSASPLRHASHYKTQVEALLPTLFQDLGWVLREGQLGRMTAAQTKDRVLRVLMTWADWSLFPPVFLEGLRTFFLLPVAHDAQAATSSGDSDDFAALRADAGRQLIAYLQRDADATAVTTDGGALPTRAVWATEEAERLTKVAKAHGVAVCVALLPPSGASASLPALVYLAALQAKVNLVAQKFALPATVAATVDLGGGSPVTADAHATPIEGTAVVAGDPSAAMPRVNEDIDGVPLAGATMATDEDIDGVPLTTAVDEDIDGVPLTAAVEEDIDGVPLTTAVDEDIDGVPLTAAVEEDIDGVPLTAAVEEDIGGVPLTIATDEDIDGVPLTTAVDEDVDGVPLSTAVEEDIDGVPLTTAVDEDIDGVPLSTAVDEDIDGVPLSTAVDEDVDGVPLSTAVDEDVDGVPL